ncbi:hypothetical protein [Pedobacter sp. NJ-S-72]
MEKLIELLLGNNDWPTFVAAMIFALIGAIISLRVKASKRDKLSPETPYKFSLTFLVWDNLLKLLASALPVFIGIRFSSALFGQEVTMVSALFIGYGSDR